MKISNQLKKARKDKKLTQEYVASQVNVSRKTISSWENGHGHPNSEYLKQLNSIYDTNLQFHYTQENKVYNNKYFILMYFVNFILFVLCLINLFTGFLTGIAAIQLIFSSFFFINYRINILYELKKEKRYIIIYILILILLFGIIMNNLGFTHKFNDILNDLPLYMGAFFHSLMITSSFFIITNYKRLK